LALSFPYWFGAAASLSGDVCAPQEEKVLRRPDGVDAASRYRRVFGDPDDPRRKAYDLFRLAEAAPRDQAPALFMDCGQEDDLLPHNRDLHRRLTSLRVRHEFIESPGDHDWEFWDLRLPDLLAFTEKSLTL
jgi:S-formylglutathione hydrolase FrmB